MARNETGGDESGGTEIAAQKSPVPYILTSQKYNIQTRKVLTRTSHTMTVRVKCYLGFFYHY